MFLLLTAVLCVLPKDVAGPCVGGQRNITLPCQIPVWQNGQYRLMTIDRGMLDEDVNDNLGQHTSHKVNEACVSVMVFSEYGIEIGFSFGRVEWISPWSETDP